MIWNEAKECMSRDELMTLQGERLVSLVKRVYYSVEYYRRKMQQAGIEPGDIRGIEDLHKLPFTTKEDLRQLYPFGHLAVSPREIVRYYSLNCAAGTEAIIGCTRNDVEILSECMARCIYMSGLGRNDNIHIAHNYGLFTGMPEAYYGVEKAGAAVTPSVMYNTAQLMQMMKDLEVTGIMCTPSYLMHIAETVDGLEETKRIKLKTAICGTERWAEGVKKDIEERLNISIHEVCGLSEPTGPGIACDCEYHMGFHVPEDFYIPEIIRQDGNNAVTDGEEGELVFTTLLEEATPLLRYRTDNLTTITYERCKCGRTSARIGHFRSKAEEPLVIRGVNIFRYQLENVLSELNDIHARYLIRIYREAKLDMLEVLVELTMVTGIFQSSGEEAVKKQVAVAIRKLTGITPKVQLVAEGVIQHYAGRISKVVDER